MNRILKSEFYRIRHTWLIWIHIAIPVLYALIFFFAAKTTGLKKSTDIDIISNYFVILSSGFPIIIASITAKTAEMEMEAGHFQVILSSVKSRIRAYYGKIIALLLGALFSLTIAVVVFYLLFGNQIFSRWILEMLFVFVGCIPVYAIHLFVSLKFNGSASIGLGFLEAMLAMLCMTGLGDGMWYFIPGAWSARLSSTFILGSELVGGEFFYREITKWCFAAIPLMILIFTATVVWFNKWDGKSLND